MSHYTKRKSVRGGGDDIAVLEGVVELLRGNETAGVGDIGHEPGALLGSGLLQLSVVPITGVSRGTADNETGLEDFGLCGETSIVNEVGLRGDTVGKGLEVNRRRGHFLLRGL
jgi:hypothetical protein